MKEYLLASHIQPLASILDRSINDRFGLPHSDTFIDGVNVYEDGVLQAGMLVLARRMITADLEHAATNIRILHGSDVMYAGMINPPKETDPIKAIGDSLRLYESYSWEKDIDLPLVGYTYNALAKASRYFGFTTLDTAPTLMHSFFPRVEYYASNPRYLQGKPYEGTRIIYMAPETLRQRYRAS